MPISNRNLNSPYIAIDHIVRNNNQFDMDFSHHHREYEIYFLIEGERIYFIKDQSYKISKGDIVLIPPNTLHKTLNHNIFDHERLLISFNKEYISHIHSQLSSLNLLSIFNQKTPVLSLNLKDQEIIQDVLFKIHSISKQPNPINELYLQFLIGELLILLHRFQQLNIRTKEEPNPKEKRIFDIVHYINNHYRENLSLEHISNTFYLSSFYLSRLFKEVTGFSFNSYINQVRVIQAKKLLHYNQGSITTISELVGFESSSHFGRVFKKYTNQTPLQYRKSSLSS